MKILLKIFLPFLIWNTATGGNLYNKDNINLYSSGISFKDSEYEEIEKFNDYDSEKIKVPEKKLPNPLTAVVLAIFPGILIHGSGHFYVGDGLTGGILLGIEAFSIIGAFLWLDTWVGMEVCKREAWDGSVKETCYGILTPTLFYGSWLYDVIGAPIKASNMRKEYEKKKKEKENILKPEIGLIPLTNKAMQSSSGEVSFLSSYYKVQDTSSDLKGGMILLTWKW